MPWSGSRTDFCGNVPIIGGWRCTQYDGIVAMAAGEHFGRGQGVNSMMVVLLVAGIGLLLAGLVAIGFGIQINEFSLGNTLIVAGTVAACTGMLLLGLWTAVKELKTIARRLGPRCRDGVPRGKPVATGAGRRRARNQAAENGGFLSREQPGSENAGNVEPARVTRHRRHGMGRPHPARSRAGR